MEKGVIFIQKDKITIQEADYIENGCYIEIIDDKITLYEIPLFGGEKYKVDEFKTLIDAIKHSKTLT